MPKKLKKMPLLFTFLLFSTFHDGTRGIKQSSLPFYYVKFSKSHFELIVRSDARNSLAMSSGTAIELSENKFESLFAGADNKQAVHNFNFRTQALLTDLFTNKKNFGLDRHGNSGEE